MITLLLTAAYARARFVSERAANAQVPQLVDVVLDRLASQKQAAMLLDFDGDDMDGGVDGGGEDPWLFLPNLRDDVLRSIHSLPKRERLWQRVIRWVEQNSNVRTGQREGRNGEVGRAWEWIGPVAAVGLDGGSSSHSAIARRRRSQRFSYGTGGGGSEFSGNVKSEQGTPEAGAGPDRSMIHRKWEEGRGSSSRPIY